MIHTRYDAEGNRTAKFIDVNADGVLDSGDTSITVYGWDVRDRLTSVTTYATFGADPAQIVQYRYDPENRLVGETVDSNGDGVVDHQTFFVHDGKQIALQFDKDGSGAVTGTDLSHRYLSAVDQVFADEQVANPQAAGNVVWPLADQLGTVRDLAVSQNGVTSVANHRVFDSYGNLVSQTNAAVDYVFGFTGFLTDKATGLDMSQTRPYEASTGRWLGPDWKGFEGGDTNLYRYVGNSPTMYVDPTGMNRWLFHGDWMPLGASNAPVLGWLAHWYIVVEDPRSTTGFTRLDWSPAGYLVTPNAPSPRVPGNYGVLEGEWRSNAAQDRALIDYWQSRDQDDFERGWFSQWCVGMIRAAHYAVGVNCMTIALINIDYGGDAGPAKLIIPKPPPAPPPPPKQHYNPAWGSRGIWRP